MVSVRINDSTTALHLALLPIHSSVSVSLANSLPGRMNISCDPTSIAEYQKRSTDTHDRAARSNMAALSTPPGTPPPSSTPLDIVSYYQNILSSDKSLTPAIAAIESLIKILSTSPLQTVSETLSLLASASTTLLDAQQNPLPVSAGTDLFQRYLITSFNQTPLSAKSGSDFNALRNQLITNSKLFVARAKQARSKIATHALPLLGPENEPENKSTIITYGPSRVVSEVLRHAAEKGRWFNIIHILPSPSSSTSSTNTITPSQEATTLQIAQTRKLGVKIATAPLSHLDLILHSLPTDPATRNSSTLCLLGAEAVLENGSVVAGIGTALIAQVARAHSIPLYIAAESYKFVRQFPIGYGTRDLERMGTRQTVLAFLAGGAEQQGQGQGKGTATTNRSREEDREFEWTTGAGGVGQDLVDVTGPTMVKGLITENGVVTPHAVAEELIKLWF